MSSVYLTGAVAFKETMAIEIMSNIFFIISNLF